VLVTCGVPGRAARPDPELLDAGQHTIRHFLGARGIGELSVAEVDQGADRMLPNALLMLIHV